MIASEPQNIFLPNFVWWCSIISQSVLWKKDSLLSSRSRSRWGLMWLKYDSFYYIFWTIDSLATKLGLMIHYCKPEWPVKKNGLVHSGSRSQWRVKMSVNARMISSEPQNILLPNLVWWCIIMSQSFLYGKEFVCYLQGQGHSKGSCDKNMTLSVLFSELWIPWQPNLVWWYIIISQSVLWKRKGYCIQGQGHSKGSKC